MTVLSLSAYRDHCQPDACVTGRSVDNRPARPKLAAAHCVPDDEQRCPILYRLTGVQELALAKNIASRRFRSTAKLQKRRVADEIKDIAIDVHE